MRPGIKEKPGLTVERAILIVILLLAAGFFILKVDLTKIIFTKSVEEMKGPENNKTMTKEQYAEIVALARKRQVEEQQALQVQPAINEEKETAISFNGNQMFVPVTIGYRGRMVTVPLQIDTGSTSIVISPAIAIRLGIKPEDTTASTTRLADGRTVANKIANAAFVAVGPKTQKPSEIHVIGSGYEETGLLGMSFLAQYPHIIDVKAQVIKWL